MIPRNKKTTPENLDPLYVIFEHHLYHFCDADTDRRAFIAAIVSEYLQFLRKNKISVPSEYENAIIEELGSTVSTMLTKKIYGCLTIEEFQKTLSKDQKKNTKNNYRFIQKKQKAS